MTHSIDQSGKWLKNQPNNQKNKHSKFYKKEDIKLMVRKLSIHKMFLKKESDWTGESENVTEKVSLTKRIKITSGWIVKKST